MSYGPAVGRRREGRGDRADEGTTLEPLEFLRLHPPFDRLTRADLDRIGGQLEIAFHRKGERLLVRGGPPSTHLFVVRKGAVRLERDGQQVQAVEEGECFGFPSLLAHASPVSDAVVVEDALVYAIPAALFDELRQHGGFAEYFEADLSDRLRRAAAVEPLALGLDLARGARELAQREVTTIGRDATVGEAAQRMTAARTSSVIVAGSPPGILTDRDFRTRVLAAGRGPETPVVDVMSHPARTLDEGATLYDALFFMLEHGLHHVPLADGGRITAILTDTDLLRAQVKSPLYLLRRVMTADLDELLAGYRRELADTVAALDAAGLGTLRIGRVVARINDALSGRLCRAAEDALGPPPAPYAWVVFGSEGRREQHLPTDQDNAIVHADEVPAEHPLGVAWYAQFARRVVDGLIAAGFPPCRGGFMATNWCHPMAEWQRRFRAFLATPDARALLDAASLFDLRAVHGDLALEPLFAVIRNASHEPLFLSHLAAAALRFTPPLGLFRTLRERGGGIDLKAGGLMPIVGLARVYGLEAGATTPGTLERIEAARASGALSHGGAEGLIEGFRFLLRLRLRAQLAAHRARRDSDAPPAGADGAALPPAPTGADAAHPAHLVRLDALTPIDRRHLKDVFVVIRDVQEASALRFAAGGMR